MGEIIADFTHAATILRNVPESWHSISQHHRLAHTNYGTLENMKQLNTVKGYYPNTHMGLIP